MNKEKNLDWMSASSEDIDLVGETSIEKDATENQEETLEELLEKFPERGIFVCEKDFLIFSAEEELIARKIKDVLEVKKAENGKAKKGERWSIISKENINEFLECFDLKSDKVEKMSTEETKIKNEDVKLAQESEINMEKLEGDMYEQLQRILKEEYDKADDREEYIEKTKINLGMLNVENIDPDDNLLDRFGFDEANKTDQNKILVLYKKVGRRALNELGPKKTEGVKKAEDVTMEEKNGRGKLIILSEEEAEQEKAKVENYETDKINNSIRKMRDRLILLKEQLEKEENEDKERMIENEIGIVEDKLKIYENRLNELGGELKTEEIFEKKDRKEIEGRVEKGINYKLNDEQFENIKLFLEEPGEGKWRTALLVLSTMAEEDFGLPGYFDKVNKGFSVEKKNDNLVNVSIFTDEKKFDIEIEFDFDKKSIYVNVAEKDVEKAKPETEPETPEKPEIKIEIEKEPRTIGEIIEILGSFENYEMFKEIYEEKRKRKAEMRRELNRKEKDGEEISKEERKEYDNILEEEQRAKIDVDNEEIGALYLITPRSEEMEDWIIKRKLELTELLKKNYEILGKMKGEEERKFKELSSGEREAAGGFCSNIVNKGLETFKRFTNKDSSQQTEKPEKVGLLRSLRNRAEERLFGNSTESEKDRFKKIVVLEFLEVMGKGGLEEALEDKGLKDGGYIRFEDDDVEIIAKKLFDKNGGDLEELKNKTRELKFWREDFEGLAGEKEKKTDLNEGAVDIINNIEEAKGFMETIENIENIGDLDEVIEKIEEIGRVFNERKDIDRTMNLLNIITNYKKKIMSGDEEEFKKVEEGLEVYKSHIDNFKASFFGEDDLKKLFEKVGELVERKREDKERLEKFDILFAEEEFKKLEDVEKPSDLEPAIRLLEKTLDVIAEGKFPKSGRSVEGIKWKVLQSKDLALNHYFDFAFDNQNGTKTKAELSKMLIMQLEDDRGIFTNLPIELKNAEKYAGKVFDIVEGFRKEILEDGDDEREDSKEGEKPEIIKTSKDMGDRKKETGEITDEMEERIREGFEKMKKSDNQAFLNVEGLSRAFSNSKKSLAEDFGEEYFERHYKDLNISSNDTKKIKTKDFMEVLKEIYEEVEVKEKKETEEIMDETKDKHSDFRKIVAENMHSGRGRAFEKARKIANAIENDKEKFTIFLSIMTDEIDEAKDSNSLYEILNHGFDVCQFVELKGGKMAAGKMGENLLFRNIWKATGQKLENWTKNKIVIEEEVIDVIQNLFFNDSRNVTVNNIIEMLKKK